MAPDPTTSARRHVKRWRDALWASDLTSTDKLVALAYADHAGDGPLRVWVSAERLQARTSLGRTATTAAVRRLRAAGWLTLTSKGRVGATARYALTLPGADVAGLEHDDQVADVDVDHREHEPRAPRVVSPRDEWVSPRDESVSAGDTDPLPIPYPIPTNQPLTLVKDAGVVRDGLVDGMVEEIRSHALAVGLPAAAARTHAFALRAAGWTPDSLGRELRAMDTTGVRNGPGLLRFRLGALAQSGPAPAPASRAAVRPITTSRQLLDDADADVAAAPPTPETLAAARAAAWPHGRPTTTR
ncbi:hypothetical protein ACWFQT_07225 [Cellulosimicrobium cellulans]